MTFTYPAVFAKNADGYTGYFPDLDGCTFSGDTLHDCIDDAIAAERAWIEVELEEEAELPQSTYHSDIILKENEFIRPVEVIIRLVDGWDE